MEMTESTFASTFDWEEKRNLLSWVFSEELRWESTQMLNGLFSARVCVCVCVCVV